MKTNPQSRPKQRRRQHQSESPEKFVKRLKEDPCSPLNEYGANWPAIKARENALLMKIHYWAKLGNKQKATASQNELFEFWESPREL